MSLVQTIGYEATSIDEFIQTLTRTGVKRLLDVRAVPVSRRKGFSKNALAAYLAEVGIEYVQFRELGDPKPGREAARAGRYTEFRNIFKRHLQGSEAQRALETAARLAAEGGSCLLCYEREPIHCHRAIVAGAIKQINGGTVEHLYVNGTSRIGRTESRTGTYPRKSCATA